MRIITRIVWLALALVFIVGDLHPQTPTFTFSKASPRPSSAVGLGTYSQGNNTDTFMTKDLLAYQGAQGQDFGFTINVSAGTTSSFADGNVFNAIPVNFAAGWIVEVKCHGGPSPGVSCSGGAFGQTATVASNTASQQNFSGTFSTISPVITGVSSGVVSAIAPLSRVLNGTTLLGTVASTNPGAGTLTLAANATGTGSSSNLNAGPVFTLTAPLTAALGANDNLTLSSPPGTTIANPYFPYSQWQTSGTFGIDTATANMPPAPAGLPSNYTATQVDQVTLAPGGTATLTTYLDGASAKKYTLAGAYRMSVLASVRSGSSVSDFVSVSRSGGVTVLNNVQIPLTGGAAWTAYSATSSSVSESTSGSGNIVVSHTFGNLGSTTAVIDFVPGALTEVASSNASPMRDAFIATYTEMGAGEMRFNNNASGGGCSLNTLLTPMPLRRSCSELQNAGYTAQIGVPIGLHEQFQACVAAGAKRCMISIPSWWPRAMLLGYADYVGGGSGTAYGAIRVALGQTAAWNTVFTEIVTEFANEVWNGATPGVAIVPYQNLFPMGANFCAALKTSASWNPAVDTCALPVPEVATDNAANINLADSAHAVDALSASLYSEMSCSTHPTQPQMSIDQWTEAYAQAFDHSNSVYRTATSGRKDTVYESGPPGIWDAGCTQAAIAGLPEGEGAGFIASLRYALLDQQFPGVFLNKNHWQDQGLQAGIQSGSASGTLTFAIYGAVQGNGGALTAPRPLYLSLQALNACAAFGTTYLPASTNVPTYAAALSNAIPAEAAVPVLQAAEWSNGTQSCIAIWNGDMTASHTVAWTGSNAPSGTVTKTLLSSANVTDGNESNPTNVALATSTLTNPTGDTLAPHSAAFYTFTSAPSLAPNHMTYGAMTKTGSVTSY